MPDVDTAQNWQGRTMVDPAKQRQVGEEVRKEQIEVEGDQHRLRHDQR
jgi:hypothetical protein